jgi:hypothetical protein
VVPEDRPQYFLSPAEPKTKQEQDESDRRIREKTKEEFSKKFRKDL